MNVLGYAAAKEDLIRVRLLEEGSAPDSAPPVSGILLSRLDFDVKILEIPRLPEKEIEGLVRFSLRSLYPGHPRETEFDYRIERDGARQQVIVFVSRRVTLAKYRSAAPGIPLFLPYSLIRRIPKLPKNCRIWFCHAEWVELMVLRAGILVSSTVLSRKKKAPFESLRSRASNPEEDQALPVVIIASHADLLQLVSGPIGNDPGVRLVPFSGLSSGWRKVDSIFQEQARAVHFLRPMVRLASLSVLVSVLATLVLFKQVWQTEAGLATLRKTHAQLEIQSRTALAVQKDIDDLRAELRRLEAGKPVDSYCFLSALSRIFGGSVEIRSLQLHGNSFRIEASGTNPLLLMEGFQGNQWFKGVKLSQVVPDAHSGRERFSFSGTYDVR